MKWDIFVSHAHEDKEFVRDLASALRDKELDVWFDEWTLSIGDSLRRKIDEGLRQSQYGVVILSRAFFAKEWPQKELDALVAREDASEKVILPVWREVSRDEVRQFSGFLADRVAITSEGRTIEEIADEIEHALSGGTVSWSTTRVREPSSALPTLAVLEDDTLRLAYKDQKVTLDRKSPRITLGRARSADIQVSDIRASREHAFIHVQDGHFKLEDKSTNGTFVLMENKLVELHRGEISLIGKGEIGLGVDPSKDDTDIVCFKRSHAD